MSQSKVGLGLYVHIPFCLKKCHYCNFVITTDRSPEMRTRFFDALEREVDDSVRRYGRLRFETLYFGGGTPSALSVDETRRVFALLRSRFDFAEKAEITWEVNPGDVDAEKIAAYREAGITRISLGIQSFEETSLQDMGRPHGRAEIEKTFSELKSSGFENISVDFILRLPGETLQHVKKNLDAAIQMNPAQFSLYDLEVHAATVYGQRAARGELVQISEEDHEEEAGMAEAMLEAAGYEQYALGAFARPGYEARHNLNYWHNGSYLGLGPGAFGYMEGVRYQRAPDVRRWIEKCLASDFEPDTADHLSPEQIELETLLTGLRLREGIELKKLSRISEQTREKWGLLVTEKLLVLEDGRLRFTPRGRFLAESVFAALV